MLHDACMSKSSRMVTQVRELVQVDLAPDDIALLTRLVEKSGLTKDEILRRGLRSFAMSQQGSSPMLQFVELTDPIGWREGVAEGHDASLAMLWNCHGRQ